MRVLAKVRGNSLQEVTSFRTPNRDLVVVCMNTWDKQSTFKLTIDGVSKRALRVRQLPHSIMTLVIPTTSSVSTSASVSLSSLSVSDTHTNTPARAAAP